MEGRERWLKFNRCLELQGFGSCGETLTPGNNKRRIDDPQCSEYEVGKTAGNSSSIYRQKAILS